MLVECLLTSLFKQQPSTSSTAMAQGSAQQYEYEYPNSYRLSMGTSTVLAYDSHEPQRHTISHSYDTCRPHETFSL
eukprot:scaffold374384_cov39-Prasinocladus_malaysianus.AAC.1